MYILILTNQLEEKLKQAGRGLKILSIYVLTPLGVSAASLNPEGSSI